MNQESTRDTRVTGGTSMYNTGVYDGRSATWWCYQVAVKEITKQHASNRSGNMWSDDKCQVSGGV